MTIEAKDKRSFSTWLDDEKDPKMFYVAIPIAELTDAPMGTAMARGVMDEAKQVAVNIILLNVLVSHLNVSTIH